MKERKKGEKKRVEKQEKLWAKARLSHGAKNSMSNLIHAAKTMQPKKMEAITREEVEVLIAKIKADPNDYFEEEERKTMVRLIRWNSTHPQMGGQGPPQMERQSAPGQMGSGGMGGMLAQLKAAAADGDDAQGSAAPKRRDSIQAAAANDAHIHRVIAEGYPKELVHEATQNFFEKVPERGGTEITEEELHVELTALVAKESREINAKIIEFLTTQKNVPEEVLLKVMEEYYRRHPVKLGQRQPMPKKELQDELKAEVARRREESELRSTLAIQSRFRGNQTRKSIADHGAPNASGARRAAARVDRAGDDPRRDGRRAAREWSAEWRRRAVVAGRPDRHERGRGSGGAGGGGRRRERGRGRGRGGDGADGGGGRRRRRRRRPHRRH